MRSIRDRETRYSVQTKDGTMIECFEIAAVPEQNLERTAIIAHPWGPLGGNADNNVVIGVFYALARAGFTVIRFNFRGCGGSKGWSSLTGKPEQKDIRAVIDHVQMSSNSPITVIGYSYGSMVCGSVLSEFRTVDSFVGISYPYGVSWALSLCQSSHFIKPLERWTLDHESQTGASNRTMLMLMGVEDNFTGAKSFEGWMRDLADRVRQCQSSSDFSYKLYENIDHFWGGSERMLGETILKWLRERVSRTGNNAVDLRG
eukprot:Clim_evm43s134 gene=Clim_evmTU43s134